MVMNGVLMQYFEWDLPDDGTLWKKLAEDAEHLASIGISHVWMPPATKGQSSDDVGYGTYDLFDIGEFDQKGTIRTKYGTRAEYQAAIDALHEQDIWVLADAVLNHKGGADETEVFQAYPMNPTNRQEKLGEARDIEGWTKFTFPGRNGEYSDFIWDFNCFSGTDFDQKTGESGIFMIKGENKGWADDEAVDGENGNFDYLMFADIDYGNPYVQEEVLKWAHWYLDSFNLNGFRMDALKHIDFAFVDQLISALRESKPDIYVVGEYWQSNTGVLFDYLAETDYQIDLFDVALHQRFKQAATSWDQFDMGSLLEGSLLKERPDLAVPFVDNHDSQPGQSLESWVDEWFKPIAYGVILLHQSGLPAIFYGDYYGIESIDYKGFQDTLDKLLALRQENAYGDQHDYFDHKNCIGYTRTGDDEHPDGLAFIATNGEQAKKRMYVGELHVGEEWVDAMGEIEGSVTIEEDGTGVFKVHAGSMSVWVNKSDAEHIAGEADEDFEDTSYFEETPTEEMAEPDVEAAQVEDDEVVAADQGE